MLTEEQPLSCSCRLRIPRLQGGQEATLTADAELTATTHRQAWSRPPINIDFSVVMFTASGLLVRFLKVFEKGNYQSVKWVRYLTKAQGSYQVRVSFSPFWPYLGSGTESFALWLLTVLSRLVRFPPCTLCRPQRFHDLSFAVLLCTFDVSQSNSRSLQELKRAVPFFAPSHKGHKEGK